MMLNHGSIYRSAIHLARWKEDIEMKPNRQLKLRAIALGLALSITLAPAFARRAHATDGSGGIVLLIIAGALTYITAKALVCTPIAAARASKNENGFGGAYKDCWNGNANSSVTANDETPSAISSIDMPSKSEDTATTESPQSDDPASDVNEKNEEE